LFYFRKQKDLAFKGVISLLFVQSIDCLSESVDHHTFEFKLNTPSRCFIISADSAKEMYDWVVALKLAKSLFSKYGDKKVTQIEVKEILPKMSSSLSIKNRKVNKKTHANCFTGSSCIDWMMVHLYLESRGEAVILGNKLLSEGFIHNLTSTSFVDEPEAFYQFLKVQ